MLEATPGCLSGLKWEAYGADNYLSDLYHDGLSIAEFHRRVEASTDQEICLSIQLLADAKPENVVCCLLDTLRNSGFSL